jgi:hypothetical protein
MRAGTEGLRRASGLEDVSRGLSATWKIQATQYQSEFSHAIDIRSYSRYGGKFGLVARLEIAKRKEKDTRRRNRT